MNTIPVKNGVVLASTLLACLLSASSHASDADSEGGVRVFHISGIATTGANDLCGEPVWVLPAPFPPRGHFSFVGEYNPASGAIDATPLSSSNCKADTILATTTSANFQAFLGFPDADNRLKNIRLRDVAVVTGLDGVRGTLPAFGQLPPNPVPPTRSTPNGTITLGDWLKAQSSMTVRCFLDGTATVKAQFKNLIPNGVYGMYGIWQTTPAGSSQPTIAPVAFGGFPSVVPVDSKGSGVFERKLAICPMDTTPDGSVLMFVDLAFHGDGSTHGGYPITPLGKSIFRNADGSTFESTRPPGTATFVQIGFPITVRP